MRMKRVFKRKLTILIVVMVCLFSIPILWAYSQGSMERYRPTDRTPDISRDNALKIAKHKFENLKLSSDIKKIELVEKMPAKDIIWEVYSSDGDLQVDATTGKVKWIFSVKSVNDAASLSGMSDTLIQKDDILARVRQIEIDLDLDIPEQVAAEARLLKDNGIAEWVFIWPRETQGYKYHDDFTLISVDAYRGNLIGYNKNHDSKEPTTLDVKIDISDAINSASKVASAENFTLKSESAKLMIVNPNYRWTENFVHFTDESRIAWVIDFDKAEGRGEIWIDASTGDMLGGIETR